MLMFMVVLSVMQLTYGTGYEHDNGVTYCWESTDSVFTKVAGLDTIVKSGSGNDCPVVMEVNVGAKDVVALKPVPIEWSAHLNEEYTEGFFDTFNAGHVARDVVSGKMVQVIHSNVHTCEFGTNCDPFDEGRLALRPTVNAIGNFSRDGKIAFSTDTLVFSNPGVYSIMSHVILPGALPTIQRFDFTIYARITVHPAGSHSIEEHNAHSSSLPLYAILLIIAGIILIVCIIGCLWNNNHKRSNNRTSEHHLRGTWSNYKSENNTDYRSSTLISPPSDQHTALQMQDDQDSRASTKIVLYEA